MRDTGPLEAQLAAVADVLEAISASASDAQPVFDAIVRHAVRLCGAEYAVLWRLEGTDGVVEARGGNHPNVPQLGQRTPVATLLPGRRVVAGADIVHLPDMAKDPEGRANANASVFPTRLGVAIRIAGELYGWMNLVRTEVRPFTDGEIELVRTFARQAAIAIGNVRLFNETKEALAQQTATAEVLKSISQSVFDLPQVLGSVVESATRLSLADFGHIYRWRDDAYYLVAQYGRPPASGQFEKFRLAHPASSIGKAFIEKRAINLPDLLETPEFRSLDLNSDVARPFAERMRATGIRSVLSVPLIREGAILGVIGLIRYEVRPFTDAQVQLVQTFADQAVIAIENVRLFNETKEALAQQTAVSEVLGSISASAFDLNAVLQTITDRAAELASADTATLRRLEGDGLVCIALHGQGAPSSYLGNRMPLDDATLAARAVRSLRTHHVNDVRDDPLLPQEGTRSRLAVPIVREGTALGVIVLSRVEVRPFTPDQIRVVETFAKQAAIAMENVRLFNETKEALDQQTATSEVLQSISRSAFDLQAVLDTVVERAAQLCGAEQAWMRRIEGDEFRFSAYYGASSELRAMFEELRLDGAMARIDRAGMGGRAVLERRAIHVHDIANDEQLREASLARRGGGRTCLAVPMLRDGEPIGAIVVARNRVAPFSDREIQLVETFADQAVIAIENVRLFNEIHEKSQQLEIAGRHKSEFLANMSHELRTPLNAIIGFSEVLLQGMFGTLNDKQREYQQDVLSSGRHLLSLINDILDLSKIEAGHVQLEPAEFSLAAALENGVTMVRERATRHAIGLTLELNGVDRIVADERKVKQVIFNLLTNAVKFTPDGGHVSVRAACESSEVRVAVRDTGIGIDIADRERIFLEFQQASRDPERSREGTGLGLALSKRYVELHGGRIWVESEVGRGSTFTFALPLAPTGKEG